MCDGQEVSHHELKSRIDTTVLYSCIRTKHSMFVLFQEKDPKNDTRNNENQKTGLEKVNIS